MNKATPLRSRSTPPLRQNLIKSSPSVVSVYRLVPVMLVLVMGISLACFRYFFEPVAYVSIDVNPSIELVLNRLGNVTAAEAYNNDGQLVLGKLTLTGLPVSYAPEQILTNETMQPYLTEENDLTITVAAKDPRQEEALLAVIAENPVCQQSQGVGCHGQMELVEQAHQAGMSMGKYRASMELCRNDSTMTLERCAEMTMAQIHACLRELEAPEEPGDKNCTAESGDRSCSETTGETHHGALRQQQQNGKNHHREHK